MEAEIERQIEAEMAKEDIENGQMAFMNSARMKYGDIGVTTGGRMGAGGPGIGAGPRGMTA